MRILLIEDDREAAAYLHEALSTENHDLELAYDGREGLTRAAAEPWDMLIVDRMLPGMDGLDLVRVLRRANVDTPVLFLTTMTGIDDRVAGLRAGGDDYLAKPFAFEELAARVAALGRRSRAGKVQTSITIGDLHIDLLLRSVRRAGDPVDLQPKEYQLLEYLARHAGQVVTRTMLLEGVWDFHFDPRTNLVESHISRLRGKLDRNGASPPLIHTVRNAGYRLGNPG